MNQAGSTPLGLDWAPTTVRRPAAGWRVHGPVRILRRLRGSRVLGWLFLAGVTACTVLIVVDGGALHSSLVPRQPPIASWLGGLGEPMAYRTFAQAMVAMTICYAGVIWRARAVGRRGAVAVVVALYVLVSVGPVLISQDVFQYIDYARLGALHHHDPYTVGPAAAPADAIYPYLGPKWHHTPSAYGPLFTMATYPFAHLGIDGSLWGMRILTLVAALGTLWLVWRCAEHLGRDPVAPMLLVALNPLLLIYGLGGSHNDLLAGALTMAGVLLVLQERDGGGAAAAVAAAAIKASSVIVLPFMLLARRRLRMLLGALGAVAVIAALAYLVFGSAGAHFVSVLDRNANLLSTYSFPAAVAHLLGDSGVSPFARTLLRAGTVAALAWLAWRTWRGYDWISAAAWALLIVAVASTWLVPWYLLWPLPLAAVSRDRRVQWAVLAVSALYVVHVSGPLFWARPPHA